MFLAKRLRASLGLLRDALIPVFLVGSVAMSQDAGALPVTYSFTGVVTNSSFGSPAAWSVSGGVVGTPVSVSYTFESSTPNTFFPAVPTQAYYQNSISSMTVNVAGTTTTYVPSSSKITVLDNIAPTTDRHLVEANGTGNTTIVKLDMLDFSGLALNTNALPTSINLPDYQTPSGTIDGPGGFFSPVLYFNITSVSVPEPVGLTVISAIALITRRRKSI